MNLNYTSNAVADLETIHAYIAQEAPVIADQVIARILQSLAVLEHFPLAGREGRIPETREWSIARLPYIGVYRLASATDLEVIAIVHTSRKFPDALN